ncbi:MAG: hypothetical protein ACRDZ2_09140, partial [Ilumatobacteraceae bacterium]
STTAPTTSAAPATTAATSTSMGDMMMVEVNAIDYAFEDLPASVPAGTMLNLTNSSTAEVHELVAFRLPDDETRPIEELVMLPEAEFGALLAGEPATVIVAPPSEGGFPAVGDGTLTEPGRYAIMCFIPVGADPAPSSSLPHAARNAVVSRAAAASRARREVLVVIGSRPFSVSRCCRRRSWGASPAAKIRAAAWSGPSIR